VIVFVGPRQTEYASTHGTMQATSTTQLSSSKKRRKHHPMSVIAASFPKFARIPAPAHCSRTAAAPHATASTTSCRSGARQSGSASHTSPKTAGISRKQIHARLGQSDSSNHHWCVA